MPGKGIEKQKRIIETESEPQFDAVIALGKNWRLPVTTAGNIHLSLG